MDTKVNQIKALFEYLDKKDINQKTMRKKLMRWNNKEIVDLYGELFERSPYTIEEEVFAPAKDSKLSFNPFDFYASPVLSGGTFPCAGLDCRLRTADELARFVALYADHVLILHPLYDRRYDLKHNYRNMGAMSRIKSDIETDFRLLFYYRPLLEEGIVGITPHGFRLCKECQQEAITALKEIETSAELLAEEHLNDFKIEYGRSEYDNLPSVTIDGPDEFIPHAIIYTLFGEKREFRRKDNRYWITQLIRSGLSGILHPFWTSFSYLTDHVPDIAILKNMTNKKFPQTDTSLLEGMSHSLPFIYNVPFSKLIKLRTNEGEAFRVYRDSLRLALKSASNTTGDQSSEVFNDIVLPELNKIDNTIKNSKKILGKDLAEDLLIGAGVMGLGLFAGLVSPTFGACVAALGGVDFASKLVKQANHVLSEPASVRDNGYYFLWRVRKESRKY